MSPDDEARPGGFRGVQRILPITPSPVHPRHILMRMPKTARAKEANTIVLPEVDLAADFDAIKRGEGWFDGATRRVWIHRRLYGQKETGLLFPIRGEGFIEMDRQTYTALTTFRLYNGVNARSLHQVNRDPYITDEQRDVAIGIWELREHAERGKT
ncbi:MAG: hypothetical protein QM753_07030 [Thermomicrobiales bacterium]